eukprot:jgi/Tetstr1/452417/TSEL_039453.t1
MGEVVDPRVKPEDDGGGMVGGGDRDESGATALNCPGPDRRPGRPTPDLEHADRHMGPGVRRGRAGGGGKTVGASGSGGNGRGRAALAGDRHKEAAMFFDGWDDLVRLVVIGVLSYVGLVVILRATGKRTLSKMNAFDLVITVALGSTLSSALLSQDVSLSEGLLAFVLLCALQYGVTFLSVRSEAVQGFVKAEPSLLYFKGPFVDRHMKRERVTREEILAAMRASGAGSLGDVEAVVLETDGSFSVVRTLGDDKGTMDTVKGMAEHSGA